MERAALADALAVGCHVTADNLWLLHLDSGDLLSVVDRREDGHVGIAFTATWTADLAELCQ